MGGRKFVLEMMPKNSVCAEIGVWKGAFTAQILQLTEPRELNVVDPWQYQADKTYKDAWYGGRINGQKAIDDIYDGVKKDSRQKLKVELL